MSPLKKNQFSFLKQIIIATALIVMLIYPVESFSQPRTNDEQLAIQYFSNREFEKAALIFANLYNSRPDSYYYAYYLQSLIETQKYEEAEDLVKKHKKKNNLARFTVDLGFIYELLKQPDKAKKEYEKAIKNVSAEQFQIIDLANAFLSRRHADYAIETYKQGRKIMNNPTLFSIEIAQMYQSLGNISEMIEEYLGILEYSPNNIDDIEYRLQGLFADDDQGEKYEIVRKAILKRAQKQPENMGYATLLYWLSLQKHDFNMAFIQAKAIDKRFTKTNQVVVEFAQIVTNLKHWEYAINAYQYVIDQGENADHYLPSKLSILEVKYQELSNKYPPNIEKFRELDKLYGLLIKEYEFNPQMASYIRIQANIRAYYLNQSDQAAQLLNSAIKINGIDAKEKAMCKIDLANILLYSNNVWDATLLYSQVEKDFPNDTLGQNAKFKNAKLSFYIGEFEWSKAQLDVLRSATSKLIANDAMQLYLLIADNEDEDSTNIALKHYANADLYFFRKMYKQSIHCLDSIGMLALDHPLADEVLFKKAEIAIGQGDYLNADTLLTKIYSYYSEDILADDALFLSAEINQTQLQNNKQAALLYEKIILNFPGSVYVNEARKRFRELRGDKLTQ